MQLSPMKGKYFHGQLADDKALIRIIGFDSSKQQELMDMHVRKQQPVILKNCQLKGSKFSEEMEIILTSSTKVALSEKKFNVNATSEISLDAIETLPDFQVVCVKAKVTKKGEPIEIKPGLHDKTKSYYC